MKNFYYLLSMMNLIIKVFNLINIILKCINKIVLYCKCEVNVVRKRLLQEDLVLSLAYHNIQIEMTVKIVAFL